MNFEQLARERLSQLKLSDGPTTPWIFAVRADVRVAFAVTRPVCALTKQGVVTLDVNEPWRANGVRLWRALAELELRARNLPVTRGNVEELAMALALPERLCQAVFAEEGYDGEALDREQPYAAAEWIATRLERLYPGTRLRLVTAQAGS